jgi:serine protease Do
MASPIDREAPQLPHTKEVVMKKIVLLLAVAVVLTAAGAVYAGDHGAKSASAESCLAEKANKMARHGWLGVETEKAASGGYAVTAVAAGSPAEAAGFRAGDVLLALNGIRFAEENGEALKKAKAGLGVGSQVRYTVARNGGEQQLSATLAPVPREVLARWLGEDVLDHHVTVQLADTP